MNVKGISAAILQNQPGIAFTTAIRIRTARPLAKRPTSRSRSSFALAGTADVLGHLRRLNLLILSTMKYASARPLADPGAATRKLVEIASVIEPVQDGRIYIELVKVPFLKSGGSGEEFRAGIALAMERGWLELPESGTYLIRLKAGHAGAD